MVRSATFCALYSFSKYRSICSNKRNQLVPNTSTVHFAKCLNEVRHIEEFSFSPWRWQERPLVLSSCTYLRDCRDDNIRFVTLSFLQKFCHWRSDKTLFCHHVKNYRDPREMTKCDLPPRLIRHSQEAKKGATCRPDKKTTNKHRAVLDFLGVRCPTYDGATT